MSASSANPQQALVSLWLAQLIGTIVITVVVLVFIRSVGPLVQPGDTPWPLYAIYAALAATIPPLLYLSNFKRVLDADLAAVRRNAGTPDPEIRAVLMRALSIGGGLCELPLAFGVVHLLVGGETRWFLGSAVVTLALRLSYRPFERLRK